MNLSRMISDIGSTVDACVQYESCTDANVMPDCYMIIKVISGMVQQKPDRRPTLHLSAVSSMCVASRLWMKFGGNAEACFIGETSLGWLGSET